MSIKLRVNANEGKKSPVIVQKYEKDEVVIGRHKSNDFVLDKDGISERHAKIRITTDEDSKTKKVFVTDLGSKLGVSINDAKIKAFKEVEVKADQSFKIGKYSVLPTPLAEEGKKKGIKGLFGKSKEEAGEGSAKQYIVKDIELTDAIEEPKEEEKKKETKKASQETETEVTKEIKMIKYSDPEEKESEKDVKSDLAFSITNTLKESDVEELDFEATKLLNLSGIVSRKGKPLAGVQIDAGALGSAVTGETGKFSFADIAEGSSYELKADKEGYRLSAKNAHGTLEENNEIEFSATKLVKISGKIVHKGKPLAGVKINCGEYGKTETSEDGVYSIADIPEGSEYTISVSKSGYVFGKKTKIA